MEVRVFELPTEKDGISKIESCYCKLYSKYRDGENLDEVELAWMDSANNWLMSI